ncbi:agmatine deiminase family protein [Catenulispora pinisilvae]|uniref:agmatine deiminase family protein n=1 Tax=Catenulispora pinisilvae TaxID=2705253 RepID=UPI001891704C|nr:agmatine deiminase family protein [Catenulispora pinisilvae]
MYQRTISRRAALTSALGIGAVALGATACGSGGSDGGEAGSSPAGGTSATGTSAAGPGASSAAGTASSSTAASNTAASSAAAPTRVFGAEWDHHIRTFMAWPASDAIWGGDLPSVQADIANLARVISGYEHVVLLARPDQQDTAQNAVGSGVEVIPIPVDDLWIRDTAPVFVQDSGKTAGVNFHFNGWGNKQQHALDAGVAAAIIQKYQIPGIDSGMVAEGGALETDGKGTLMATESSLVNDNRNPGKSRQQIEDLLKTALGVTKVIWFTGVKGQDITDAHVDCLARFAASGAVLLDKAFPGLPPDVWSRASDQARSVLATATDAAGKKLQVVDLPQPDPDQITGKGDAFVSSYANFFVANGAVIMPKFGDADADDQAKSILAEHFPGRRVVPVAIDAIAAGGGGIHCATHDMPGAR